MSLTITVSVEKLLKTLAKNRDRHFKEYEKAKKGWLKLLRKEVAGLLDDLDGGKSISENRVYLKNGTKPTHYLHEYDGAMEMLNFSENETIELDQTSFQAYVKDDWDWKKHFAASNSTYIAAGR